MSDHWWQRPGRRPGRELYHWHMLFHDQPRVLERVYHHPQAVVLAVEPSGALDPVLDVVRTAARVAGCNGHTDTDPWRPHVSVAYPNRAGLASPIVASLGRWLPRVEVTIRSVSLVRKLKSAGAGTGGQSQRSASPVNQRTGRDSVPTGSGRPEVHDGGPLRG